MSSPEPASAIAPPPAVVFLPFSHMSPHCSSPASRAALAALAAALLPAFAFAQTNKQPRPNHVAATYAQHCASCHGDKMQGAQAPSMLDDIWINGGDDESLARSIRNGFPDKGMPAWGASLPEKEIRAMVIYMREQRAAFARGQIEFPKPADNVAAKSVLHDFQLSTWVDGVNEPWSLAFLPDGRALVTEKKGKLFVVENGKLAKEPVGGLPAIDTGGQAGLFDVVPHPRYAENGWLYFAFSDLQKDSADKNISMTRIIRGKLAGGQLVQQETIFQAPLDLYRPAGGVHFGGRIAFDRAGYLFFSIGERGQGPQAQELGRPNGKIHRLHDDGRLPADNPFVNDAKAMKSIWSYGHRNPQGLVIHPVTGQIFDVEHGPRGGDELNLVQKGKNYGWPVISYGMNYDGSTMTELTAKEGMEQPVTYWVPSLAVCGLTVYSGSQFPKWQGHLFLATLAAQELRRLEVQDGKVVYQEILFKNLGRIRHVIGGPDGALYVLLPNRIARLSAPAKAMASN